MSKVKKKQDGDAAASTEDGSNLNSCRSKVVKSNTR
jgi:hypothetical protein